MPEPTKAIRFIRAFATERECFMDDRDYEFPAGEADAFITNGMAREVARSAAAIPHEANDEAAPAKKGKAK